MNKNQITMAAIGGVSLVAALAVGFFAFSVSGESGEKFDELEGKRAEVSNLKGAAIAPCQASVDKIKANDSVIARWSENAFAIAAKGDAAPAGETSPAAFKQRMVEDARELSRLPGGVNGAIVKPGFGFGFPSFINEGAMPKAEELPLLDRQWSETCLLVKTLAECGVSELVSIEPAQPKQEAPAPKEKRGRSRKAVEKPKEIATAQAYVVKMTAKPLAFVKVLNALTGGERFIVVDNFSFTREDDLGRILGEGKGKPAGEDAAAPQREARGRGRRRGAQQAEEPAEAKEEIAKKGLVTDPALAAPLSVTIEFTTFDFGSKLAAAEGEQPKAAAPAAGKDDDEED